MSNRARACFFCRRSVKIGNRCPECGRNLVYMGWAFKPPRRRSRTQWRKVYMIRRTGRTFEANMRRPPLRTLRDTREWLAEVNEQRERTIAEMRQQRVERDQMLKLRAKAKRRKLAKRRARTPR